MSTSNTMDSQKNEGGSLPLISVRLDGVLTGNALACTLEQHFRNSGQIALEAVYKFPLPDTASVRGFRIRRDETEIKGEVEERNAAFTRYDKALAAGHSGFLVDEERPNIFTLSVGNLQPGEEALIQLDWFDLCPARAGLTRITLPLTIAPRYVPVGTDDPGEWLIDEAINPPLSLTPDYKLDLSLEIQDGAEIISLASPTHSIRTAFDGGTTKVEFTAGTTAMDRDFVLEVGQKTGASARAWHDDKGFLGLDLCVPSNLFREAGNANRDLVFLLDCSGSMEGDSIAQAKRALHILLSALPSDSRFAVYRFGSTYERHGQDFIQATPEVLSRTQAWLAGIDADLGGTELLTPLQAIIRESSRNTDIILLTDGEVSNENDIIELMAGTGIRVFTIGIGHGPNSYLLRELARVSSGTFSPVVPGERIEPAILSAFNRARSAPCTIQSIDWHCEAVQAMPVTALFPDEHLLLPARTSPETPPPEISLNIKIGEQVHRFLVPVTPLDGEALPLATHWGRERIRHLETRCTRGSRQRHRKVDSLRDEIISISREFNLLSRETSFIGVEQRLDANPDAPIILHRIPSMLIHDGLACMNTMQITSDVICEAICEPGGTPSGTPFLARRRMPDKNTVDLNKVMSTVIDSGVDNPSADSEANVLLILSGLQPEGFFELEEQVYINVLKANRDFLADLPPAGSLPRRILETSLAIAVLKREYPDQAILWQAAAEKSEAWLMASIGTAGEFLPEGLTVETWTATDNTTPMRGLLREYS